jgi:hypothetical protein
MRKESVCDRLPSSINWDDLNDRENRAVKSRMRGRITQFETGRVDQENRKALTLLLPGDISGKTSNHCGRTAMIVLIDVWGFKRAPGESDQYLEDNANNEVSGNLITTRLHASNL